jgi:hypothetical protein
MVLSRVHEGRSQPRDTSLQPREQMSQATALSGKRLPFPMTRSCGTVAAGDIPFDAAREE